MYGNILTLLITNVGYFLLPQEGSCVRWWYYMNGAEAVQLLLIVKLENGEGEHWQHSSVQVPEQAAQLSTGTSAGSTAPAPIV